MRIVSCPLFAARSVFPVSAGVDPIRAASTLLERWSHTDRIAERCGRHRAIDLSLVSKNLQLQRRKQKHPVATFQSYTWTHSLGHDRWDEQLKLAAFHQVRIKSEKSNKIDFYPWFTLIMYHQYHLRSIMNSIAEFAFIRLSNISPKLQQFD
jgi:hypothetical protein